MAVSPDQLKNLRARITNTIDHGTRLLADLKSLDDWLLVLDPALADMTEADREAHVAELGDEDDGGA